MRRFGLRTGDKVAGQTRPPKDQEKYWGLLRVDTVNGVEPEIAKRRPYFDTLVPVFPDEMFDIETDQKNLTQRLINLISPIGKGQRGLILSPAKAGKTTVLKQIASGITENSPEALLMVALIGERPEEVTDMEPLGEGRDLRLAPSTSRPRTTPASPRCASRSRSARSRPAATS